MLREFIGSSSGLAPIRQGLGLGSAISILSGIAVLLGAKGAGAGHLDCENGTPYCKKVCTMVKGVQVCTYEHCYERKTPWVRRDNGKIVEHGCRSEGEHCIGPGPACP